MQITLKKMYKYINNIEYEGADIVAQGVCVDSRKATAGSMFVALPGENVDGHSYVGKAIENGATLILAQIDHREDLTQYENVAHIVYTDNTLLAMGKLAGGLLREQETTRGLPRKKIAVTGSVGKTTTKEMIACSLAAGGKVHKTQGNQNSEIGFPLTIFDMPEDTEYAVCEMGMRGLGQVEYLTKIFRPNIGVVTNIGTSHMELLGSRENILRAKLEIVKGMENNPESILLLNGDDDMLSDTTLVNQILSEYGATNITIKYFGMRQDCNFGYYNVTDHQDGQEFLIDGLTNQTTTVQISIPGVHNVANATVAVACAQMSAIDTAKAITAIAEYNNEDSLRQKIHRLGNVIIIDDTYNASPESMNAALAVLRSMDADIKVAVLADMLELGSFSRKAHEQVGQTASFCSDYMIAYGNLAEFYTKKYKNTSYHTDELHDAKGLVFSLIDIFMVEKGNSMAFLIKGSNAMRMNEVAKAAVTYVNNIRGK